MTISSPSSYILPDNAVSVRSLTKHYAASGRRPGHLALDAINLDIPRGSLFGLLGPNGAGKSTLINILAGLVTKTSGKVGVWDIDIDVDPRGARGAIGVVPQELNIDPFFTPRTLLELHAGLYGVPASERRTDEILARLGLSDKANAYARSLSGGMRRRLLVAKAMVHNPPILVLDEPTAGVDIELRRQLWDYVQELHQGGTTVLLTTHYLEEAESLCDRIAIIDKGRVVATEGKSDMLARLDRKDLHVTVDRPFAAVPQNLPGCDVHLETPTQLVVRYQTKKTKVSDILAAISATNVIITDITTVQADLEDIFLSLTGSAAAAATAEKSL